MINKPTCFLCGKDKAISIWDILYEIVLSVQPLRTIFLCSDCYNFLEKHGDDIWKKVYGHKPFSNITDFFPWYQEDGYPKLEATK